MFPLLKGANSPSGRGAPFNRAAFGFEVINAETRMVSLAAVLELLPYCIAVRAWLSRL